MKYILTPCSIITLLFSCATPSTETKQEPETVCISSEERMARSVYLTSNHLQQPVVCWTEEDTAAKKKLFFYAVYSDSLNSFVEKKEIPTEDGIKFHAEGMPKIAFRKNGDAYAFYEISTRSEINRFAGEIHYIVSKDGGNNWSAPKRVHQDSTQHKGWSFLDVTTLTNGEIGACWLDVSINKKGRPVKFAQTNYEGNFSNEVIVDSLACECCRTAICCDDAGKISIVYRDIINDSIRDISVATSADAGKTFSTPVCFSGDKWNVNGCPHNGPDVVSDGKNIYATWFTGAADKGVYYAELSDTGKLINKKCISPEGRYIQLCSLKDKQCVLVYNKTIKKGDNVFSSIVAELLPTGKIISLTPDSAHATLPVIIGTSTNTFLSAWIDNGKVFLKNVQH